jgi:hypothetical protein
MPSRADPFHISQYQYHFSMIVIDIGIVKCEMLVIPKRLNSKI